MGMICLRWENIRCCISYFIKWISSKSPSELGVATTEEAHYATQLAVWIAANELTEEDLVAK